MNSESFKILIVEDDRLSRQVLGRFFQRQGYQVIEACNGEEALSTYAAMRPDLVLLDAMMPNMNGFECCSRLLKLPGAENTPIIVVTGLEDEASIDWAFDAGATDYVTKPIHWPILRQRVKNTLEKAYLYRELERVNQKLSEHVITDALTGLSSRRYFDECLDREWNRSLRHKSKLSLLLYDLDYFKAYNDTYGHQAGDLCLQKVAQVLRSKAAKRSTDVVARYGGEEFATILPNTDLEGALEVADYLRKGIKDLEIPHEGAKGVYNCVTLSIGISSVIAEPDISSSDLLCCTDKALYHAKESGRNAVAIYRGGQVSIPLSAITS